HVLSLSGTGESDTGLGKPLPPVQPDPRLGHTSPGQCLGYTGIAYQSGIDERFQQRILELSPPAFGGLKRFGEGRVETIRQVDVQLRLRWGCHGAGPEQGQRKQKQRAGPPREEAEIHSPSLSWLKSGDPAAIVPLKHYSQDPGCSGKFPQPRPRRMSMRRYQGSRCCSSGEGHLIFLASHSTMPLAPSRRRQRWAVE